MRKRFKMSNKASRRHFTRHATRTHKFNLSGAPMRGGIRL